MTNEQQATQEVQVTTVDGVSIGAGGYLVLPCGRGVPDALWDRLKHEITKARQTEAFTADKLEAYFAGRNAVEKATAEEMLFRRWTERVVGPQEIWPWSRGWTPELARTYLAAGAFVARTNPTPRQAPEASAPPDAAQGAA